MTHDVFACIVPVNQGMLPEDKCVCAKTWFHFTSCFGFVDKNLQVLNDFCIGLNPKDLAGCGKGIQDYEYGRGLQTALSPSYVKQYHLFGSLVQSLRSLKLDPQIPTVSVHIAFAKF